MLDDDLTLSNGLAWTADGLAMYSIDTMRRVVFARPYDPVTGEVGRRAEWLTFANGLPDGMCLDAEEHLWIAMWGLGQVHRYTPDGELVAIVEVPAPHTSSVAFAGAELDTLVVTTATQDLTDCSAPSSALGRLFTRATRRPRAPAALLERAKRDRRHHPEHGLAMKAFVISGPRQAGVEDVDPPTADPGEVVIDVERAGICGTDVEFYTGGMQYLHDGNASYPIRIGHEWMGTVSAIGEASTRHGWPTRHGRHDARLR